MNEAPDHPRDPARWSAAIAVVFFVLCLVRIGIPGTPYFDEIHYLPAARALLDGSEYLNREHPLLGKEILALGIALLGDNPWGWRLFPALAGTGALYAFTRALWFASLSRFAAVAYGALLASGFALFVHSRIAMLDVFFVAFLALALWQCAAAVREPETGRRRLAIAGVAIGLAMAAKWNAVPLAVVPGLAFFAARLAAGRRRLFTSRRGIPVPGVSLLEAALWLGLVPLAVYAATFLPTYGFDKGALQPGGLIELHRQIVALQESVVEPHPYQSRWPEWIFNLRAIWYLYEPVDGAQRGILLIGNPLTMLLGLPAMVWVIWRGAGGDRAALSVAVLYAVSLGFWMVVNKPVQFYYHYFLPSCFLLAALALALAELRQRGWRRSTTATLLASVALFVWFYPILSAAPLVGEHSFAFWMWLDGWR
ncbi:phospholipid carrier-dependent glycosyltransferase [Altererythrobacter sp. C41]|uniref:phospholipid carrier-dependent glycosyltransferase n=1 Tax=Altererythrobacter sp. C41 TaxID=2806021 RepID=UPI0019345749|nr:phospholipid carrier-dependent glycosyltransferase [Altererythrobacter sp. C41]MBM0170386.1 phospholipid carrier-dependent glycosyltransferase [Altererythrobacter sp. C41]